MEGLIGSNEFSAVIYATRLVQGVILSHHYKAVVQGVHPNQFTSMEGVTKGDLQDHLDAMRYYEKKSYLTYKVNISVVSIKYV